jgi:hypothetical protein
MRSKWLYGLLLSAAFTVPTFAQVSVYIGSPPPALRYERRGDAPGPGYSWVEGYWAPHGRRYAWVGGHWAQPPYSGGYWNHPHYDHYQQGWQLHEGHWDHEDHDHEGQDHR